MVEILESWVEVKEYPALANDLILEPPDQVHLSNICQSGTYFLRSIVYIRCRPFQSGATQTIESGTLTAGGGIAFAPKVLESSLQISFVPLHLLQWTDLHCK